MTKYKNFEEYLQDVFLEDYHGTKDDASDAFDSWLERIDIETIMDYADLYAEIKVAEFRKLNLKR